jgi:hypothetical protein
VKRREAWRALERDGICLFELRVVNLYEEAGSYKEELK